MRRRRRSREERIQIDQCGDAPGGPLNWMSETGFLPAKDRGIQIYGRPRPELPDKSRSTEAAEEEED